MDTIVDKIIDLIDKQAYEQYDVFARGQLLLLIDKIKNIVEDDLIEESDDFEKVVRPVLKYLCENHHPHVTVIITPTSAELVEGVKAIRQILDYVKD
jgi:hypothetical protein